MGIAISHSKDPYQSTGIQWNVSQGFGSRCSFGILAPRIWDATPPRKGGSPYQECYIFRSGENREKKNYKPSLSGCVFWSNFGSIW